MAILFATVLIWLTFRQYATFQTRGADVAIFDHGIWNTLQGRFLYSTIRSRSLLASHFSPYMALLAPLYLIWSDGRVLYIAQAIGLTVAGLLLYRIVREKHPGLAPWFLLAYYLNPALHEVALLELRRVTLAVPYLALAMYAVYTKKRWLIVVGLFLAVLCKENIGLLIAMVGIYLLLFERDWKWGGALVVFGITWLVSTMLWIIPAFNPAGDTSGYRLLKYFSSWGDSFGGIATSMLQEPLSLLQHMFDREAVRALWRVFMPLGIALPFLAPDWILISIPSFMYMLASTQPTMHRLEDWYMATVLPVVFAAIAVTLNRHPVRWARWFVVFLLGTTILGYRIYSFAPLGGKFDPSIYILTDHHRLAEEIVAAVPADARVAAQVSFITHVTHREYIYHYPKIPSDQKERIEYYLFDRQMNAYPFQSREIDWEIDNLVADPKLVVEMEGDGLYLLHRDGKPLPSFPMNLIAEDAIRLDRVEVAVLDDSGFYAPVEQQPVDVRPGQEVRVTVYWEALAQPKAERTVSVRISDATGALIAQHDMQPSKGARPTSWWEAGWFFRDVYYLTVSPNALPGSGSLDILLYDSYSQEWVSFQDGTDIQALCNISILPQY